MEKSLVAFLADKPLYYKEIDHERVHIAYRMLKPHIRQPRTVHIVGTNGKGSTGRMIAYLAFQGEGVTVPNDGNDRGQVIHDSLLCNKSQITRPLLSVGHYSSPHILRFNERIWIDGEEADDALLEAAHQKLYGILGRKISVSLSYFEYSTLLALVVFEHCDLMVLEAGLGGEYDATNVCNKALSVITPIGIDHQAFLGETIEEIAATKIRSIQKKVLLAPQPYPEVVEVAKAITSDVGADLFLSEESGVRSEEFKRIAQAKGWPPYLLQNAAVAMQALDILEIPYDLDALEDLELFGRFYPLAENIRIDVGHNTLAAEAIVEAMEPETVLIYNSLDDKDYEAVLRTLKPKIKRVEIIPIDSQRATTLEAIETVLKKLEIPYRFFPNETDDREQYLVFGSFYTVEAFLQAVGFQND